MKITSKTALILTLLATFFWGSNFQATKFALESISPWTASTQRFIIAVIGIFTIMLLKEGLRPAALTRNLIAYIILGIIGVAAFNSSLFIGLQTSSPITASLIMATTPISANIIEALLNRKIPERRRIAGMIISLIGVSTVISNGNIFSGKINFASGDLIIFIGSISWAIYTVGIRAFISDSTPLETTSWTMLFGTITLIALAFFFEDPITATSRASMISLIAIIWMGIAGSVLAYLFWNIGIAIRGAGNTSVFINFVPIFAMLISILLGAVPHAIQFLGIALTICGVLLGQWRTTSRGETKTV